MAYNFIYIAKKVGNLAVCRMFLRQIYHFFKILDRHSKALNESASSFDYFIPVNTMVCAKDIPIL
ncbi:hypothetical protein LSO2F_90004 [Candidatus Liberibacter solanacearum]